MANSETPPAVGGPPAQIAAAAHNGDCNALIAACEEVVLDIAGRLVRSSDDKGSREWIPNVELSDELELEAGRLRHSAGRLAALRARVVADFAAREIAVRSNPDGGGAAERESQGAETLSPPHK